MRPYRPPFQRHRLNLAIPTVDLPRFGGQLRAWDQSIWSDCILPSCLVSFFRVLLFGLATGAPASPQRCANRPKSRRCGGPLARSSASSRSDGTSARRSRDEVSQYFRPLVYSGSNPSDVLGCDACFRWWHVGALCPQPADGAMVFTAPGRQFRLVLRSSNL